MPLSRSQYQSLSKILQQYFKCILNSDESNPRLYFCGCDIFLGFRGDGFYIKDVGSVAELIYTPKMENLSVSLKQLCSRVIRAQENNLGFPIDFNIEEKLSIVLEMIEADIRAEIFSDFVFKDLSVYDLFLSRQEKEIEKLLENISFK